MKKLYLFDFDGTLTYKDTMFLYLRFYNTIFVILKLKIAEAEKVKKSLI